MADLKISQLTGATTPLAGTEVVPLVQSGSTKKVAVSDLTAGRSVAMLDVNVSSSASFNHNSYFRNTGALAAGRTESLWLINGTTFFGANDRSWGLSATVDGTGTAVDLDAVYYNGSTYLTPLSIKSTQDVRVNAGNLIQGTAAKGINFTANTPAAGMTSQLLNWYEEGTFTPTVYGGTTAGTTTYVSQVGRYTRVGNVVYYRIYVDWSNQTGTGTLYVGGLPFTSVSLGSTTPGSVYANNLTFTANASLSCAVVDNTTTLFIVETVNNTGAGVVAVDTSASLVLAGMYFTS